MSFLDPGTWAGKVLIVLDDVDLERDVMKALDLAEHIPAGLVHINDLTVNDEAIIPFGGVGESGTGSRHGGTEANLDAFTETQCVTVRGEPPRYPF